MVGQLVAETWTPWLPPGALEAAFARIDLSAPLVAWSAHWLGHGPIGVAGGWHETKLADEGTVLQHGDGKVGLWLAPDLRTTLQVRMFGSPPYGAVLTSDDRDMLDQAVDACIHDLCLRICGALGLNDDASWRRGGPGSAYRTCPVGKSLAITVSTGLAVQRFKAAMPAPRPGTALAARLDEALSGSTVTVGARIGACQLNLAELGTLTPGDVIALDGSVTKPVQITIDDTCTSLPCLLVAEQDDLTLVLQ